MSFPIPEDRILSATIFQIEVPKLLTFSVIYLNLGIVDAFRQTVSDRCGWVKGVGKIFA